MLRLFQVEVASLGPVESSGVEQVWCVSAFGRWGTLVGFGGFSLIAPIDNALNGYPWQEGLAVGAVLMPLWLLFAYRPLVSIRGQDVLVRNPLWTVRVPSTRFGTPNQAPALKGRLLWRDHV